MKIGRILSTAGVCRPDSIKLRSYCNLMQGALTDKWLFADDFVDSHVCFVRDDYLNNMDEASLNKAQVIVVLNTTNKNTKGYEYQISAPLSASKIKDILNKISRNYTFNSLDLIEKKPKNNVSTRLKKAVVSLRKNFFGRKKSDTIDRNKKSKREFISRITKAVKTEELRTYKIVLLGSPGSGKTTAIQSISKGNALNSDVSATDSVASQKLNTTVGIDYAEIKIKQKSSTTVNKVRLIGTPGQIKFNFIWDMVGKGADAFIILLDLSRPEPNSYLKFFIDFLRTELGSGVQIYCALTHCDKFKGHLASFSDCIENEYHNLKGVYHMDPREGDDISMVVSDIHAQLDSNKDIDSEKLKVG